MAYQQRFSTQEMYPYYPGGQPVPLQVVPHPVLESAPTLTNPVPMMYSADATPLWSKSQTPAPEKVAIPAYQPVQPTIQAPAASYAPLNLKPVYACLAGICLLIIPILALSAFAVDRMCDGGECVSWKGDGLTSAAPAPASSDYDYSDPNSEWTGTCATGRAQSPINLVSSSATAATDKPSINKASFQDVGASVSNAFSNIAKTQNSGHSVLVDTIDSYFNYGGVDYKLLQFHFHTESEHEFNGARSAAEAHFVHQNLDGALLVIGVMIDVGNASPSWISQIASQTTTTKGEKKTIQLNMSNVLDSLGIGATSTPYWTYPGSLTTPPCSEGVTWVVLQNKITATKADIDRIAEIEHSNYRPVQPLNGRTVLSVA